MKSVAWFALPFVAMLACGGGDEAAPAPVAPPPPPVAAPPPAPPPTAPTAPVALEEYFKIGRVTGLSSSFDEKLVAYLSDEGGRPDVWVKPLAGGPATQLTHVNGFVHSFSWCPTADILAFESDGVATSCPTSS